MTDAEALAQLKQIIEESGRDKETAHALADDLIVSLLKRTHPETAALFEDESRYWWYA